MKFADNKNKKVLLRERKRHTARRVVSTPSVVLPGYPPLWTDRLMDGQTRVKTLPSLVLRTRAVITVIFTILHEKEYKNKYFRYILQYVMFPFFVEYCTLITMIRCYSFYVIPVIQC